jgi:hypothetical protein
MPRSSAGTFTKLFVTSGWPGARGLIEKTCRAFLEEGWGEERDTKNGTRCLTRFNADVDDVRRVAEKSPGLIFQCFTMSFDSDDAVLHIGIGSTWLARKIKAGDAVLYKHRPIGRAWVRIPSARGSTGPRGRHRKCPNRTAKRTRSDRQASVGNTRTVTRKASKAKTANVSVSNRLVFHGLPDEVKRCRMDALEMLPVATQAGVKYETAGSETYASGTLEFTTAAEPAFRVFNRLVAQVPGVTVSLEYDDVKTGQRRLLRAIDGRVIEHKVISPSTAPRENRQQKQGKGR